MATVAKDIVSWVDLLTPMKTYCYLGDEYGNRVRIDNGVEKASKELKIMSDYSMAVESMNKLNDK